MRAVSLALTLLVTTALAGCSFGGNAEGESSDLRDKSEYAGGAGVALAVRNNGTDPILVTVDVLGGGNAVKASLNETVEPGTTVERWYSLESGTYSARFTYVWTSVGHTSRGDDAQEFSTTDCPAVTRLVWSIAQSSDAIGSSFDGRTCVSDDNAENA